jgi:DNA end-binding protein Ku
VIARETIRSMDMVAIGRVVLTRREHIIGLKPLDKGLMGTLRDPPSPMVSTTRPFAVGAFRAKAVQTTLPGEDVAR